MATLTVFLTFQLFFRLVSYNNADVAVILEMLLVSAKRYSLAVVGRTTSHVLWSSSFMEAIYRLLCRLPTDSHPNNALDDVIAHHCPVLGLLLHDPAPLFSPKHTDTITFRRHTLGISLLKASCDILRDKISLDAVETGSPDSDDSWSKAVKELLQNQPTEVIRGLLWKLRMSYRRPRDPLPQALHILFTRAMKSRHAPTRQILRAFLYALIDQAPDDFHFSMLAGARYYVRDVAMDVARVKELPPPSKPWTSFSVWYEAEDFDDIIPWLARVLARLTDRPRHTTAEWLLYLNLWVDFVLLLNDIDQAREPWVAEDADTLLYRYHPEVERALRLLQRSRWATVVRLPKDIWQILLQRLDSGQNTTLSINQEGGEDDWQLPAPHASFGEVNRRVLEAFRRFAPFASGEHFELSI